MKKTILCALIGFLGSLGAFAQSTDTLFKSSVQEIMALPVVEKEEETVTTASKKAESALVAPAVITVITAKEIEAFGALNLGEVLDRVTSMYLSGALTLTPSSIFAMRGTSSSSANNQLLVLLNGQPIREPINNSNYTNLYRGIPLQNISRIEVIRGSGSVLYGSNANQGVISIFTKEIEEPLKVYGQFRYGQFETWQTNVGISKKIGKLALGAHILWNKTEGWDYTARGESDMRLVNGKETAVNAPKNIKMNEDMKSALLEANIGGFKAHFFHSIYKNNYMGITPNWGAPFDIPSVMTLQNIALSYLKKGEKWEWNTHINYTYFNRYLPTNAEANPIFAKQEGTSRLAETSFAYTVSNKFNFLVGLNTSTYQGQVTFWNRTQDTKPYDINSKTPNPDPYKSYSVETETWYCLYVQGTYKPFPFLNVDFGGQFNKTASPKWDFVPRLNTVFHWQDRFFAKLLYGEAFRAPALLERWSNTNGISTTFLPSLVGGGTDLQAEKIRTTELQLSYKHKKFQFTATLFNSHETNIISRSLPLDSLVVTNAGAIIGQKLPVSKQINKGSFDSRGLELETKISILKKFYFTGSFSWFKVGNGSAEQLSMGMPNTMLKTGLIYEEPKVGITAGIFNSYFGEGDAINSRYIAANPEVKPFHNLSLNLNWNMKKLYSGAARKSDMILNLYITNLLNEQIYYPEYTRRILNSLPARADRAIYVSVKFGF